jgi:hypothetical protein
VGLKNQTGEKWVVTTPEGIIKDVEPGKSAGLGAGVKSNFGGSEGEVRI